MKLLFDENLSPRLILHLADLFPASMHVRDVGLWAADDPSLTLKGSKQKAKVLKVMQNRDLLEVIERNPEKVSGAWVFRGTRVPVVALFENLKDGASID
jgi:predicted nuclease of predicted toxin-antitoxin system